MSKLPTAKEVLRDYNRHVHECCDYRNLHAMRVFARMHVKAALEAAANNAWVQDTHHYKEEVQASDIYIVNQSSILDAYPETNIE